MTAVPIIAGAAMLAGLASVLRLAAGHGHEHDPIDRALVIVWIAGMLTALYIAVLA